MENTNLETQLQSKLDLLGSAISAVVETGLSNGEFKPDKFAFRKVQLDGFQYTDLGITYARKSFGLSDSLEWEAVIERVGQEIQKTQEYRTTLEELAHASGEPLSSKLILWNYIKLFTQNCLI